MHLILASPVGLKAEYLRVLAPSHGIPAYRFKSVPRVSAPVLPQCPRRMESYRILIIQGLQECLKPFLQRVHQSVGRIIRTILPSSRLFSSAAQRCLEIFDWVTRPGCDLDSELAAHLRLRLGLVRLQEARRAQSTLGGNLAATRSKYMFQYGE